MRRSRNEAPASSLTRLQTWNIGFAYLFGSSRWSCLRLVVFHATRSCTFSIVHVKYLRNNNWSYNEVWRLTWPLTSHIQIFIMFHKIRWKKFHSGNVKETICKPTAHRIRGSQNYCNTWFSCCYCFLKDIKCVPKQSKQFRCYKKPFCEAIYCKNKYFFP